eukprot:250248_1
MLLWFTLLLSFIYRNDGISYYGSRRIYPQSSTSAQCSDYVEVTFDFDDATTAVVINIMSSTNASWFIVGFPSRDLYYDKSTRKSDLLNGYALSYVNGDISEHTIAAKNNIIHTMTPQINQNIAVHNIDTSDGTINITLTRSITTNDVNDFQFDLASYLHCDPFLMTVAIGDNSFGSSYVYLYDKSWLGNNTGYNQMWNVTTDHDYTNAIVTVSLTMNPVTKIVSVQVDDGPTNTNPERAWALSFPDLAHLAYYDTDPIGMESDYAILWGEPTDCASQSVNKHTAFREARIHVNGSVWNSLPNQQIHNTIYTATDSIDHYAFDLQFKSCGYEFNPYEFQTCRPLTVVAAAVRKSSYCLSK